MTFANKEKWIISLTEVAVDSHYCVTLWNNEKRTKISHIDLDEKVEKIFYNPKINFHFSISGPTFFKIYEYTSSNK